MKAFVYKYSCIAEDILVDALNHTILRNGISFQCADLNKSIKLLGDTKKSIIRWGDGEAFIILKRDIYWHEYMPALRKRLIEVIKNYSSNSPYYLCLPAEFLSCNIDKLKAKKRGPVDFYQMHKGSRYVSKRYFPKKCNYLLHGIFKGNRQDHFDRLMKLISGFKAFVVVKEDKALVDNFFKKFIDNVEYSFVQIPGKSAFKEYDRILEDTNNAISKLSYNKKEILTLVSAGPCAKVLVYDLSQRGLIAYDVGKFIECWTDNIDCRVLD